VATVQADVSKVVGEMAKPGVEWKLAGSNEDSAEAAAFLSNAFGAAMFLIFIVLLAQFNKFTSVILVLTCVVMAIVGALLGMLLTGQTFVIVMSGIGFIALAGVVVNNNIVLIDTYDRLREEGWNKYEAILQTCRERARPVVLTAVSAILGVLPIAFGLGLEIFHQETTINAPSTQWWIALVSDRVRSVVRNRSDADRDAVDADGFHARQTQARPEGLACAAEGPPVLLAQEAGSGW
jgi:multidrug efflux pump